MALILSEVRRLHTKYAFTVQFDGQVKPLEIVCDTKEVAYRRIRALEEAASARAQALCTQPFQRD